MKWRTQSALAQGGALAAAATSAAAVLCCLPLAAGVVGAGLAAVGALFAPLRPLFSALSLILLGYAFTRTYGPGGAACDAGERCGARPRRRARHVVVWLVALLVALLLTVPWWASSLLYWTL